MWENNEQAVLDKWVKSEEVLAIFDKHFATDKEFNSACNHLAAMMIKDYGFLVDDPIMLERLAAYGIVMCSLGYAVAKLGNPLEPENDNEST